MLAPAATQGCQGSGRVPAGQSPTCHVRDLGLGETGSDHEPRQRSWCRDADVECEAVSGGISRKEAVVLAHVQVACINT